MNCLEQMLSNDATVALSMTPVWVDGSVTALVELKSGDELPVDALDGDADDGNRPDVVGTVEGWVDGVKDGESDGAMDGASEGARLGMSLTNPPFEAIFGAPDGDWLHGIGLILGLSLGVELWRGRGNAVGSIHIPRWKLGRSLGAVLRPSDGTNKGASEGFIEGASEGTFDGVSEGIIDGLSEGAIEGVSEGTFEGASDGFMLGISLTNSPAAVKMSRDGGLEG